MTMNSKHEKPHMIIAHEQELERCILPGDVYMWSPSGSSLHSWFRLQVSCGDTPPGDSGITLEFLLTGKANENFRVHRLCTMRRYDAFTIPVCMSKLGTMEVTATTTMTADGNNNDHH